MKRLLTVSLLFLLVGCVTNGGWQQEFQQDMDAQLGIMSFDDALLNWGQPSSTTEGDAIFIASWGGAETSSIMARPWGKNMIAQEVSHGWQLDVTFDKSTRRMEGWSYRDW